MIKSGGSICVRRDMMQGGLVIIRDEAWWWGVVGSNKGNVWVM